MGPKGKPPQGKNAPPPVPEIDPKEIVTELQKEFFEFQLADIQKKIVRIGEREEELTAGTAALEEKIEEYKKEKGAIVAEKEQQLAMKEEEKCRKREDMIFLSEEVKNRVEKYKKRMEVLSQKYNDMVSEMTAQLEAIEEEVAVLENYRQNKDLFSSELANVEKMMNEAEMQHQRNLFEINAKWEKAKVRMKKELQLRLLQLSIEFRATSQKKIGKPCHRVTQENKAMQTALIEMKEEILEYEERSDVSKEKMTQHRTRSSKMREENQKMIARTIIQIYVIKTLQKNRLQLIEKLREFSAVDALNKNLLKKLNAISSEVERKKLAIEEIKQDIEDKNEETNAMREAMRHLKKNSRRLQVLLRNALKVAEEAMAVRLIPLGGMEEEKYLTMDAKINLFRKRRDVVFARKGRILQYLLDLLSKAQITEEDRKLLRVSTESIGLDQIDFTEIYGKPHTEESKEILKEAEEEEEKGPVFLTSLTSLPRSISEMDVKAQVKEEIESYEGEFEEYGEGYEDEEQPPQDTEETTNEQEETNPDETNQQEREDDKEDKKSEASAEY